MKKLLKLRFSYFLLIGVLGIIFEGIGFFMWEYTSDRTFSQINSSTTLDYFNEYTRGTYFIIVAAVLLIGFCYGVLRCADKNAPASRDIKCKVGSKEINVAFNKGHKVTKVATWALGGAQALTIIVCIVYLIFSACNRKSLNESAQMTFITVLVVMKNVLIYISAIALAMLTLSFVGINKKDRPISKVCSWIGFGANCLFILMMTVTFFAAIGTPAFEFLSKFFDYTTTLGKFGSNYGSMNGFSQGTLHQLFVIIEEVSTNTLASNTSYITSGAVIAIITIISYIIAMVGNLAFLGGSVIESFDVVRDDKPMSL